MRISLIAAIAENGVIGAEGSIPWRLKSDVRFFKAITIDKPVIMGRKTFESLPKPLERRTNIVLTRSVDKIVQMRSDVLFVPDIELAQLVAAKAVKLEYQDNPEIIFIGGAEIYREAIPYCNRMYLTTVYTEPEGDTLFPTNVINWNRWSSKPRDLHRADEDNHFMFDITVWDRMGKPDRSAFPQPVIARPM